MTAPTLIGVGMGPGDPELVTVKAVRVLCEADLVLVPVMATGEQGLGPPGGSRGVAPPGEQGPGPVTKERGLRPAGGSRGVAPQASRAQAP